MDEIERTAKGEYLKEYYMKEYSTDELASEINENVTFYDLFIALDTYKDVYELIGVGDSLVRERLFRRLAEIMEVDYNYIYQQYLMG